MARVSAKLCKQITEAIRKAHSAVLRKHFPNCDNPPLNLIMTEGRVRSGKL